MKKFAIMIMSGIIFCLFFVGLAALGQSPAEVLPTVQIASTPDLTVPILTTVVVVSETLPIVNKKVHGIIHLLVAIYKLFKRK